MTCTTLVAYATRFGSTKGVAESIADSLRASGWDVDVEPVQTAPAPDGYDAVVIGSAVYNARWMDDALAYARRHADALNALPNAYFQVCLSVVHAGETKQRIIDAWLEPASRLAPPVSAATFPGAIDRSRLTGGERLMVWMSRIPDGDYRDWDAINNWATMLAEQLRAGGSCEQE